MNLHFLRPTSLIPVQAISPNSLEVETNKNRREGQFQEMTNNDVNSCDFKFSDPGRDFVVFWSHVIALLLLPETECFPITKLFQIK